VATLYRSAEPLLERMTWMKVHRAAGVSDAPVHPEGACDQTSADWFGGVHQMYLSTPFRPSRSLLDFATFFVTRYIAAP